MNHCFGAVPTVVVGSLDSAERVLYAVRMTYSSDFVQTTALIAARAQYMWGSSASPKEAVEFAWFSVNQTGDASIDDHDLARHLAIWADETGRNHIDTEG